jgi:hypothetical protein
MCKMCLYCICKQLSGSICILISTKKQNTNKYRTKYKNVHKHYTKLTFSFNFSICFYGKENNTSLVTFIFFFILAIV